MENIYQISLVELSVILVWFCRFLSGSRRRGYMGHLFRIANHIVEGVEQGQNGERLKELIQGL